MKQYKVYIGWTMFGIFFISIAVIGTNIIVDPYDVWGVVNKVGFNWQKVKIDSFDRIYKPIQVIKQEPKIIILGTSRERNALDPRYYAGGGVYNLAVPAANMYEVRRFLEHTVLVSENLQEVILGVNFFAFNEKKKVEVGFDEFQLSNKHITLDNFFKTTFSKEACLKSFEIVRHNYETNGSYVYMLESGKLSEIMLQEAYKKIDEARFYSNVKTFMQSEAFYKNYQISEKNMDEFNKIIKLCKEKHIKLSIIIPPIHASQMEGIISAGSWERYEQWKRYLVKYVDVVDFTTYNVFTTENFSAEVQYFWDSSHMKSNLGNMILDVLANRQHVNGFGVRITPDNIEHHLQNIRNQRDAWRANNSELVEKIAFFKGFLAQKPRVLMGKAEIGGEMVVRVDHLLGQSYSTKQAVLKKDAPLTIGGWGFAKGQVGKEAFLALKATDGREYYAVLDKGKRQDVADMLQNQDFVDSGFSGSSFCDDVPVGKYELRLIVLNEDQQVYSAILGEIDLCE